MGVVSGTPPINSKGLSILPLGKGYVRRGDFVWRTEGGGTEFCRTREGRVWRINRVSRGGGLSIRDLDWGTPSS